MLAAEILHHTKLIAHAGKTPEILSRIDNVWVVLASAAFKGPKYRIAIIFIVRIFLISRPQYFKGRTGFQRLRIHSQKGIVNNQAIYTQGWIIG